MDGAWRTAALLTRGFRLTCQWPKVRRQYASGSGSEKIHIHLYIASHIFDLAVYNKVSGQVEGAITNLTGKASRVIEHITASFDQIMQGTNHDKRKDIG
jgi:hypothetical protein